MINVTILVCSSCGKEYALFDDYGKYCIKCGSQNTSITKRIDHTYSLYNHKTGTLVD